MCPENFLDLIEPAFTYQWTSLPGKKVFMGTQISSCSKKYRTFSNPWIHSLYILLPSGFFVHSSSLMRLSLHIIFICPWWFFFILAIYIAHWNTINSLGMLLNLFYIASFRLFSEDMPLVTLSILLPLLFHLFFFSMKTNIWKLIFVADMFINTN